MKYVGCLKYSISTNSKKENISALGHRYERLWPRVLSRSLWGSPCVTPGRHSLNSLQYTSELLRYLRASGGKEMTVAFSKNWLHPPYSAGLVPTVRAWSLWITENVLTPIALQPLGGEYRVVYVMVFFLITHIQHTHPQVYTHTLIHTSLTHTPASPGSFQRPCSFQRTLPELTSSSSPATHQQVSPFLSPPLPTSSSTYISLSSLLRLPLHYLLPLPFFSSSFCLLICLKQHHSM